MRALTHKAAAKTIDWMLTITVFFAAIPIGFVVASLVASLVERLW